MKWRPPRATRTDTLLSQHDALPISKHRIMWETVWESRMGNLTVAAVKNAKPGRHSDGAGLILFVTSKKGKSWVLRAQVAGQRRDIGLRSEEHTSELQSLMRISYAVFCLKKKKNKDQQHQTPK